MSNLAAAFEDENMETVEHDPNQEIIDLCKSFKTGDKQPLNKWLAEADEDDYQSHRKAIRTALDWDIKAVDKKRKSLCDTSKPDAKGSRIEWPSPEPWEAPVSGAELLTTIMDLMERHVILKKEFAITLTAWAVMTWFHDKLDVAPFINITSPDMRCGKSTLLDVLGEFVKKPLPNAGSITGPALFRTIEEYAPTMLLDEIDRYLKENPDLIGTINGSQRKSQASQIRCVGDDHEPRRFSTWCPKVLTGIRKIPDTVLDRSIIIRMERRSRSDPPIVQFRRRDKKAFSDVQRKIVRWIDDNEQAIMSGLGKVDFPKGLDDRAADCWECLLAIGECAGGEWTTKLYIACEQATKEKDEGTIREIVLADIKKIFEKGGSPAHISTATLIEKLIGLDDRPWAEYSRGKPISPVMLGRLLKPFKICSGTIRTTDGTPKGYKHEAFTSAWGRYLPATPPQPAENSPELDFSKRHKSENVAAVKSSKPAPGFDCGVVADETSPSGDKSEKYEVLV